PAAPQIHDRRRHSLHNSLCGSPRSKSLRRCLALVSPKIRALHLPVFSEHDKVPALAPLSSHDPWPGARGPCLPREVLFLRSQSAHRFPVLLVLLLPLSHWLRAHPLHRHQRDPLWLASLPAPRTAHFRYAIGATPTRLRLQPPRHVPYLAHRRTRRLSHLPLVCRRQTASPRPLVAQLPVVQPCLTASQLLLLLVPCYSLTIFAMSAIVPVLSGVPARSFLVVASDKTANGQQAFGLNRWDIRTVPHRNLFHTLSLSCTRTRTISFICYPLRTLWGNTRGEGGTCWHGPERILVPFRQKQNARSAFPERAS